MKTSSFGYNLPENLIAQEPNPLRDKCNLLILYKDTGAVEDKKFFQIADYLNSGDLLVANKTRVIPARLQGKKKDTGGSAEILLLTEKDGLWEALVKPGRRLKPGAIVDFGDDMYAKIEAFTDRGTRLVSLHGDDLIHKVGKTPLPPYIKSYHGNMEMYQTVYSEHESSAAAPTAGLHFTDELIDSLKQKGINFETVELEVGIDTFKPVTEENAEDHVIHTEKYSIDQHTIDKILETKENGHKIIAVGTTSVRTLETVFASDPKPADRESTSLFILPGYKFKIIDGMITNFHVPESTLMMLVSAFAGHENIMHAYQHAIDKNYRFLSFGDAMFIA